MRVVIVMRGNSIKGGGGTERRFIRLLNFLNNPEIKLLVNKELADSIFEAGLIKNKDLVITLPNKMSILTFNFWLISTIKYLKPEIIHLPLIQRSLLPFYLWLSFLDRKINVVSSMVWTKYLSDNFPGVINLFLGNLIWERSKFIDVLYPSIFKSRWFPYHLFEKVRITPCSFTDYEKFQPSKIKKNMVVFAGRFIPEKNPLLFLYSILELRKNWAETLSDWKFVILGKGPLEKVISKFIKENSLEEIVSLKNVYSTEEYLSCSKIFVSLQTPTNYPSQSLLEAMATENAIIATKDEDTRILINEECGLLINKDYHELARALVKLMTNEDLRRNLATKARNKVLQTQRIEIFSNYILNLWNEAKN